VVASLVPNVGQISLPLSVASHNGVGLDSVLNAKLWTPRDGFGTTVHGFRNDCSILWQPFFLFCEDLRTSVAANLSRFHSSASDIKQC
jgi:hypothetical protein